MMGPKGRYLAITGQVLFSSLAALSDSYVLPLSIDSGANRFIFVYAVNKCTARLAHLPNTVSPSGLPLIVLSCICTGIILVLPCYTCVFCCYFSPSLTDKWTRGKTCRKNDRGRAFSFSVAGCRLKTQHLRISTTDAPVGLLGLIRKMTRCYKIFAPCSCSRAGLVCNNDL